MKQGIKWKMTLIQVDALREVLRFLLEKANETGRRDANVLLHISLLESILERTHLIFRKFKLSHNKTENFKISYQEALVFHCTISPMIEHGFLENDSLENALFGQFCRDIHQKLLT